MKCLAVFLSIFILTQGIWMNTSELEKMDALLEHAKYHKEQYGDSFASFLSKHYGQLKQKHDQEQHEDRHEHEQLPFHQVGQLAIQVVFLLKFDTPVSLSTFTEKVKGNYFYQSLYSSLLIEEILQPPKYT